MVVVMVVVVVVVTVLVRAVVSTVILGSYSTDPYRAQYSYIRVVNCR